MLIPEKVRKEYDEGQSLQAIADKYETYPNRIRRMILKLGGKMRDKGEAQKIAIESGRSSHPTEGKQRSKEDKLKISESVAKSWKGIDDKERNERKDAAKKRWAEIPEDKKKKMQEAANEGIRLASKEGSKLEKTIMSALSHAGYRVRPHAEFMISNEKMHIDIFLPEIGKKGVAIEIDGPSHYQPIWGEDNLKKVQKADQLKNGLLLNSGIYIVRIANLVNTVSDFQERTLMTKLVGALEKLSPEPEIIELEII